MSYKPIGIKMLDVKKNASVLGKQNYNPWAE